MFEKMLETLVRIAVALEKIASKEQTTTITEKHEHNDDGTAKKAAELTEKVMEAKAEAARKAQPKPETKPETKKVVEDEITFDQCKAVFLTLAKGLRDVHGVDKMKKITLGILNDFTNGQPLSAASLPEDQYYDFLTVVEDTLSNLNADTTEE